MPDPNNAATKPIEVHLVSGTPDPQPRATSLQVAPDLSARKLERVLARGRVPAMRGRRGHTP